MYIKENFRMRDNIEEKLGFSVTVLKVTSL